MSTQQVGSVREYFGNIRDAVRTTVKGMTITLKYILAKTPETLEYPDVKEVLPDRARMRLYNDVMNCISCNMCMITCPVNCIYITAFPRPKNLEVPKTTDGTAKRQVLVQYTIDTALCCYCGLCTTVCPTECLQHTYDYEFSQYTISQMKYDYTSPEIIAWRDRIVKK